MRDRMTNGWNHWVDGLLPFAEISYGIPAVTRNSLIKKRNIRCSLV